jgi:adenine-specific DNA-methyltransferase
LTRLISGQNRAIAMGTLRQLGLFSEYAEADVAGAESLAQPLEHKLLGLALALGAREVRGWSAAEEKLTRRLPTVSPLQVQRVRERILAGQDPLGELFCSLRPPAERRKQGATYTPLPIVQAMLDWAEKCGCPERIVDPGIGSGRFAAQAGQRFPHCVILGVELDPVPAIIARANLATLGFAARSEIILGDYRSVCIPGIDGRTLYIGNPPYIRHHLLAPIWKQWLIREAGKRDLSASQLAGLHVHFFLATVLKAACGDFGTFITAAEWLDVNYGSLVRELFLGDLGGRQIVVIEPTALPFPDAASTAAITSFEVGSQPATIVLKRVTTLDEVGKPDGSREIRRERLAAAARWTHLTRPLKKGPSGYVELGELCRVHRGQVTGANKVWIAGPHSEGLPESVLFSAITKAKELFHAGKILRDASKLRKVIDLPVDLGVFDNAERRRIERFLENAKKLGAHQTYIASNRKAWWSVGLRKPAPVLATYMARRPPAFVRNVVEARHINIAHGLYPREPLSEQILTNLVEHLSGAVLVTQGRTYAGGLTKFEPREMERLLVPGPDLLASARWYL